MDQGLIFNKCVSPNKHVGWNFSKTLINMHLGSVYENPSTITTISDEKLESKVEISQFMIN